MANDERRAEIEAVAYPIFVGVAKAPWTSCDDDETCPVEPFTKNHARNLARAAIKELDRVRDARGDDECPECKGKSYVVRKADGGGATDGEFTYEAPCSRCSMTDDEQERILAAFRATTMYREATEPMRRALVQADSYLSLIGYRHTHTLPPDLRREVLDCSLLCRRLSERDG